MKRAIALMAVAALVAGCGGGDSGSDEGQAPPPPRAQDFPKPEGKTIKQMLGDLQPGPVLALSGQEFRTGGDQRIGFALFRKDGTQITNASVAVYAAPAGGPAEGPYLARYETMAVRPQFMSRQTATDPDSAKSIYTTSIPFKREGTYELVGIAKQGNKLVAATVPQGGVTVKSGAQDQIPAVGTTPPRIHTPTKASAGGDIASIDTRLPPSSMHDVDFYDVIGKKPVVLLFATPQLCQSRVCGPVVDVAEEVKAQTEGVDFIHMEIYNDNMIDRGIRPQLAAFHLLSEPWMFAFDKSGKVVERIEGAFSPRELEGAIAKAKQGAG